MSINATNTSFADGACIPSDRQNTGSAIPEHETQLSNSESLTAAQNKISQVSLYKEQRNRLAAQTNLIIASEACPYYTCHSVLLQLLSCGIHVHQELKTNPVVLLVSFNLGVIFFHSLKNSC